MKTKFLLIAVLLVSGCGGSGSNSGSVNNDPTEINYSGTYDTSSTNTIQFSPTGAVCGTATGSITITDGNISGTAVDSFGITFVVNGTVASDGNISGGFAFGGQNAASLAGQMTAIGGSGTWEDLNRCEGTWTMVKV